MLMYNETVLAGDTGWPFRADTVTSNATPPISFVGDMAMRMSRGPTRRCQSWRAMCPGRSAGV